MTPYDKADINRLIIRLEGKTAANPAQTRALLAELRRAANYPNSTNRYLWLLGEQLPNEDGWRFEAATMVATLYAFHAQKFSKSDGTHKIPSFKEDDGPEKTDEQSVNQRRYKRQSFGESVRRLRMQLGDNDNAKKSLDKRFIALLETDAENLDVPLRGFIQRIAASPKVDIPVNYRRLLRDLLRWSDEAGDKVRRRWARDYWQPDLTNYSDFGPDIPQTTTETNQ